MKKTHVLLASFLTYLIMLTYTISQPYFSYSQGENILTATPKLYWLFLILNSAIIFWLVFRYYLNRVFLVFVGMMYGLLFYILNLYFVIPYEQTDVTPATAMEILAHSSHITKHTMSIKPYFSYPVFFLEIKTLMTIADIGKISIYTVGLFTFMALLYIGLVYYYLPSKRTSENLLLQLATYIILSFYVINDQVAPQTMALVYLPYIYGITLDMLDTRFNAKKYGAFLILWIALIFTHPFMFLFYVLPMFGLLSLKYLHWKPLNLTTTQLSLLITIYGFGFGYLFYNLLELPLRAFIEQWGSKTGETWWIFRNFFGIQNLGPIRYIPHPHYDLIPEYIVDFQATFLRILVISLLLILTYYFIRTIHSELKERRISTKTTFDFLILLTSAGLFMIGLFTNFLGQRVFQVAMMPFSRYVPKSNKCIVYGLALVFILAPSLYTANFLINSTITSPMFIREPYSLSAGTFLDKQLNNTQHQKIYVFTGTDELYPAKFKKFSTITLLRASLGYNLSYTRMNYTMWSKKVKLTVQYYGLFNKIYPSLVIQNVIYNNGFTSIYSGGSYK